MDLSLRWDDGALIFISPVTMPAMLAETAYAKINLALHVRQRRADGYHQIESLFAFAEDGDRLTAGTRDDGAISLTIGGPFALGLESGPDNLVVRAAEALRSACGVTAGADIRLTKNLPIASGIGGGSADAAAALRLLSRLWNLVPDHDRLLQIAAEIGSDVPACLVSRTLVGTGRGEELDLRDIAGLAGMPLLLVNPGRALSTAAVFAAWDQQDRGALHVGDLDHLLAEARNDLQAPAIALVPEIADVLAELRKADGLLLARMSGSGATCFALFRDEAALARAAGTLQGTHPDWWIMTSRVR
jgi:4-diphosphocytidyl-2-C-methyl-D-erythritol kinase